MQKKDSGVRWLYEQLPELTTRGVLTEQNATALREYYGAPSTRAGISLLVAVTAVLGALLIGSGIILVLGANWDSFPRAVRTVLAFVPLVASLAAGVFVLLRQEDAMGYREGVALLNSLAVAASIALVSQIYQIPGEFVRFLLVWMLLTLPAIYLLRSAAAMLLYLGLALAWTLNDTRAHWAWGWLLVAAVLPLIVPMIRRGGMRAWWLAMAAMIVGGVLLGATANQAHMRAIWIPAFAGYLALLYVCGVALRPGELHPFRWLGFAAIGVLALLFTYGWFWEARNITSAGVSGVAASVVCVLALLAGLAAAALALLRNVPVNVCAAAFPLVVLVAFGLASAADQAGVATLLMNFYVLALAVTALRSGFQRNRFAETNAGLLVLTALIVLRFFDTEVGFLVRGLAFIAVGIGFMVVNMLLLKRRKAEA